MDELPSSPVSDEPGPAESAPRRDRSTRSAALWATLVAAPITLVVAGFTFAKLAPPAPAATPSPSATAVLPQSTAPVEMPAPALAERPATVCLALVSQLPASVRDLRQRPVTAGAEQNAAYGDPALTVSCGGTPQLEMCPPPASGASTDQPADGCIPATGDVWRVNGVCWYPVEGTDGATLTAVDREVPVRVRLPKAYEQPLQWVAQISDTIVATVPSAETAPAGCSG
ncbi:DUF3515 family protein [Micromonospora sp. NPDC006766]|uniref:DUF3515 family protein n=1 Tax=Micromonospora sp. NPDC006766 TaxID=3154778 RepID=UPI0033E3CDBA